MAVNDLWRIAFEYQSQAQLNVNVLYCKQLTAAPGEDAQAVATHVAPLIRDVFNQAIARVSRGQMTNVGVTKIARFASDTARSSSSWGIDGPAEIPLPSVVAAVMKIRTGLAGPTRRGRIFLGGVPSIWQTDGTLNANGNLNYGQFMDRLRTAFSGPTPTTGLQLGVFSRTRYKIISSPFDDYWVPATQLAMASPLATMHSRKVGIGR